MLSKGFLIAVTLFLSFIFSLTPLYSTAQTSDISAQIRNSIQKKDWNQALLLLNQVLKADSSNSKMIEIRAYVYNEQSNYLLAASDYKRLTHIDSLNFSYWNNTGWLLILAENYKEAETYLLKSLELNPDNYSVYLNLGHVSAFLDNPERSKYYYSQACEYITNLAQFENGILGDFALFEKRGGFPFKISGIRSSLSERFAAQKKNIKTTNLLDTICYLLNNENTSRNNPAIIKRKKQFVIEEDYSETPRGYVMRNFFWDLYLFETAYGSRLKGFEYASSSVLFSKELQDTSFWIQQLTTISKNNLKDPLAPRFFLEASSLARQQKNLTQQQVLLFYCGDSYREQNKADSALFYYRLSYQIANQLKSKEKIILAANRLSISFADLKQFDSSGWYHRYAIKRIKENRFNTGNLLEEELSYCNMLYNAGQYKECVLYTTNCLREYPPIAAEYDMTGFHEIAGIALFHQNKYVQAEASFKKAIEDYKLYLQNNLKTGIIKKIPADERRLSYRYLKRIAMNANSASALFTCNEESSAQYIYQRFSGLPYPGKTISIAQMRQALPETDVIISYWSGANSTLGYAVAASRNAELVSLDRITLLDSLVQQLQLQRWKDVVDEAYPEFAKNRGLTVNPENKAVFLLSAFLMIYKQGISVTKSNRGSEEELSSSDEQLIRDRIAINELFYRYYFKPLEPVLKGKKNIYILIDGIVSLLPFEVLKNEKGEFLGNIYNFHYVPSFTLLQLLKKEPPNKKLLMAAFSNPSYKGFTPRDLPGKGFDLAEKGLGKWSDLPGTVKEVAAIKYARPDIKIYQGQEVTESNFKALNVQGLLKKYGILHFSTHGVSSVQDNENAIVLSEPAGGKQDGFLGFYEISQLQLQAQLVCLSACESAEATPGEFAMYNLPAAFFMAGANAVIATGWKIDDEATAVFMGEFYRQVFKENQSFSDALFFTKQKFISGQFGEIYKAPYYWGSFKYYGN